MGGWVVPLTVRHIFCSSSSEREERERIERDRKDRDRKDRDRNRKERYRKEWDRIERIEREIKRDSWM